MTIRILSFFCIFFSFQNTLLLSQENDWPTFRHDSARSGVTKMSLPDNLSLIWSLKLPSLEPAWVDDSRIQFDNNYHIIVANKTFYLSSNKNDCVYAFDTETASLRWKFFADAPVRFAPVYHNKKIYFTSDDSYLYCISAEDGKLIWRFNGAPYNKKVLANGRLASAYPARVGPVIENNTIYFAAGIWSFMGCFVYALNTETGEKIWENTGSSALLMTQGHGSPGFGNIAPQGYASLTSNILLIPNGRAPIAGFNKSTGEFLYLNLEKKGTSYFATTIKENYFFANNVHFSENNTIDSNVQTPILANEKYIVSYDSEIFDLTVPLPPEELKAKYKTKPYPYKKVFHKNTLGKPQVITNNKILFIKDKSIGIYTIENLDDELTLKLNQTIETDKIVTELVPAAHKLFVVSENGLISCYASSNNQASKTIVIDKEKEPFKLNANTLLDPYKDYLNTLGYAAIFSEKNRALAEALIEKSSLNITLITNSQEQANAIRKDWDNKNQYGIKANVLENSSETFELPPYFAKLIVADFSAIPLERKTKTIGNIILALRPYGGTAFLSGTGNIKTIAEEIINQNKYANINITETPSYIQITRTGSVENSASWTHQYGDAANTGISKDTKVKLPLGVLWFGGVDISHKDILSKHGHAPTPEVAGGRLVVQGPNSLQAIDAFTGISLWKKNLPKVGDAYDNLSHQPGANAIGSNYVTLEDFIYLVYEGKCLQINAETGEAKKTIEMPILKNQTKPAYWGYIAVSGDYLIGGVEPLSNLNKKEKIGDFTWNGTTSKGIAVFNRFTGELLWQQEASLGFRHNAITVSDKTLFCIDLIPENIQQIFGNNTKNGLGEVKAFDLKTGNLVWSTAEAVFGTWLSYSKENDILLQGSRPSRDMLLDEPKNRVNTYNGNTGKLIWDFPHTYSGPCLILDDKLITQSNAFELLTGKMINRIDPITNSETIWSFSKAYGCNFAIGSRNLLVFRSAAAGYFDLLNDSGTGNFGGFKSGCTNNLIIADGVLNCPDYTRGCTCSYQNQTSLALVNNPDVEIWTYTSYKWKGKPIKKLGINLGAVGDFRDENSTIWIEYPTIGGQSQEMPIKKSNTPIRSFRSHSLFMKDPAFKQIGASGVYDLKTIFIPTGLDKEQSANYQITLYFNEPKEIAVGQRLLNIEIQGKMIEEKLDIISFTKSPQKVLRKEFSNILANNTIEITLTADNNSPLQETILSGIEITQLEKDPEK